MLQEAVKPSLSHGFNRKLFSLRWIVNILMSQLIYGRVFYCHIRFKKWKLDTYVCNEKQNKNKKNMNLCGGQ